MLLAIDIGNTNISLGIFRTSKPAVLAASWRLSTIPHYTADEYGTKILDLLHYAKIEKEAIKAIYIANVVPSLTPVFKELSQKYFHIKPGIIGENVKIPIPNLYENPKEVGADRIVNAVAAFTKFGGPCIVVDFGTATTFDCITKKGEYAGGIIVPGPSLSAESLALHTAKLPKVEMEKPNHLIGKNTIESIQSGLYFGYVALVDGLIDRLKKDLGTHTKIIATGGLASLLSTDSEHIQKQIIIPELTLEGICILFQKTS